MAQNQSTADETTTITVYRDEWRLLHDLKTADHGSLADVLEDVLEEQKEAQNGGGAA